MGEITPINELLPVLVTEGRRRQVSMAVLFAVIALVALAAGAMWPKKYEASTTILVQETNIITPLMEGRAVATGVANRAAIAREVIFSRKVMDAILAIGGWMKAHPSPIDQDRTIDGIKGRTKVTSSRDNLITIDYTDSDPQRCYAVTQRLAQMFIQESLDAKMRESRDAFEFIDSQVKVYHQKLADAEGKLKTYRESSVDARPGSEADTNARIGQLRSSLEQAQMDLTEQRSAAQALQSQLSGESEVTAVQTRGGQIRAQMAQLQGQLDTLLLTYTNEYPDVVRIRHQIDDLRKELAEETARQSAAKQAGTPAALDDTVRYNPLYQDLRSKLSDANRDIASTSARLAATQNMLNSEMDRAKRIADSENVLSELTRDYEVNRDVYQDLLKRRENARVSMDLDKDHRGLSFKIQDPATLPLRPSGLRFMHFALAGLGLAVALPLGLLFLLARFDPRARSVKQLDRLGIPMLATVPLYATSSDRRRQHTRTLLAILVVGLVFAAYLAMFWLRLKKML
jgi:polysaccharide chain length determinant protein (PEP-CTERM system associated)